MIEENSRIINVCNAPSPAATASFNIGESIMAQLEQSEYKISFSYSSTVGNPEVDLYFGSFTFFSCPNPSNNHSSKLYELPKSLILQFFCTCSIPLFGQDDNAGSTTEKTYT